MSSAARSSAGTRECSEDAAALQGLGFLAIAWVVLNHFRDHLGLQAGASFGLVAKGYLGAALYFVLAGFLIAREYVHRQASVGFNYPSFLWRQMAGLYPLHLLALAAMVVLWAAGRASGAHFDPAPFKTADLPANLLLIQAWGVLPTVSWNFPSWFVSALWFAFLTFPVTAWLAFRPIRPPALAVLAAVVLFVIVFEIANRLGTLFTDMTAQIGALQTVPAFLYGAALYRLSQTDAVRRRWAAGIALASAAWIVVASILRLSDLMIWPAFGPLVLGLAAMGQGVAPSTLHRASRVLGAMSISMFLVYLPVDIIYFHAIERLFGTLSGGQAWLAWCGVFPVVFLAAVAAYFLVARPAARWLRNHDPFERAPKVEAGP